MTFAGEAYIRSTFALSHADIGERMIDTERKQGFERVIEAEWLDWGEWHGDTIITQDGDRIRLVALNAKYPGQGAFTRLIERIQEQGLIPVLVEPNRSLIDWCLRRNWRHRRIGKGWLSHEVWYPRR